MEPSTPEVRQTLARFVALYVPEGERDRALVTLATICESEYMRGAVELVRIGRDVLSAPPGSEDGRLALDALREELNARRGR
jgi:hypothetical protein